MQLVLPNHNIAVLLTAARQHALRTAGLP